MKIDHSNIGQAVDLLVKGFPTRTPAFWEVGLSRILASPAHSAGDRPVGCLLEADGKPVGVGLTATAPRHAACAAAPEKVARINLASWYVDPEHRWRMPILLRRMMSDKKAVYTDLTPTPEVQPLLTSLGFNTLNNGVTLVNLPGAAVKPGQGYSVSGITPDDIDEHATLPRGIVEDHISYGCLALRIAKSDRSEIILLKPSRAKNVPMLQMIYCADNELVRNALPDIARFLIKRCHFGLVLENEPHTDPTQTFVNVVMTNRRKRYIKNGKPGRGTDFTYTELAFFDF
jgi:hypothetical protein